MDTCMSFVIPNILANMAANNLVLKRESIKLVRCFSEVSYFLNYTLSIVNIVDTTLFIFVRSQSYPIKLNCDDSICHRVTCVLVSYSAG